MKNQISLKTLSENNIILIIKPSKFHFFGLFLRAVLETMLARVMIVCAIFFLIVRSLTIV